MDDVQDRDVVAGLEKGLSVIEAFDQAHPRLTLSDVAKATGLTRAAARRYLLTLVKNGYAAFDGRFFSLTARVLRLGYAYLSSAPLPARLQPFLERISETVGESSSAATLDGTDVIYVARSATSRIMAVDLGVGSRLPAYCTALGRVFLAHLPAQDLAAYFGAASLQPLTPKTKYREADVRAALAEVRRQGYALVDEELELGVRSIAVPVFDAAGTLVVAVNISVGSARMDVDGLTTRLLPMLREAQADLRVPLTGSVA
jgi:IclR family pca regulon transcriptional regulator